MYVAVSYGVYRHEMLNIRVGMPRQLWLSDDHIRLHTLAYLAGDASKQGLRAHVPVHIEMKMHSTATGSIIL